MQGTNAEQRSRSAFASTVAFALACVSLASSAGVVVIDAVRTSMECGTFPTILLGALTWTGLVAWIVAVVVGVVAIVRRAGRPILAVVSIGLGILAAALWLFALNIGICSLSTP
jgi:hypothetical protein